MTALKLMNLFSGPTRQRCCVAVLLLSLALSICWPSSAAAEPLSWDDVLRRARGQTVDWFMWGGFPSTNAYVNGFVASRVNELYGVKLRQVPVTDIAEVISKLLVEKQAGKMSGGQADLLWINGENFRTAKRNGLLYGPFADRLPNQVLRSTMISGSRWKTWSLPGAAPRS
jgi:putative spermidine/putrescine transport system substrate-binding protein